MCDLPAVTFGVQAAVNTATPQPIPDRPGHRHGDRWQELLDNGTYPTVRALAKAVKQDTAYVARTIRLTLLAPEITEVVTAGQSPPELTLKRLSREFPIAWDEQRREC